MGRKGAAPAAFGDSVAGFFAVTAVVGAVPLFGVVEGVKLGDSTFNRFCLTPAPLLLEARHELSELQKKCIKKTHRITEYCISPNLSCCAAFTFCGSWLNAHPKRMVRNPSWLSGGRVCELGWVGLGWA